MEVYLTSFFLIILEHKTAEDCSDCKILMGCDGNPLSREQMMESLYNSGQYDVKAKCNFAGPRDAPLGKIMDNSFTREKARYHRAIFVAPTRVDFGISRNTSIHTIKDLSFSNRWEPKYDSFQSFMTAISTATPAA